MEDLASALVQGSSGGGEEVEEGCAGNEARMSTWRSGAPAREEGRAGEEARRGADVLHGEEERKREWGWREGVVKNEKKNNSDSWVPRLVIGIEKRISMTRIEYSF